MDRGTGTIETVVALGLASLVTLGLLSVSLSLQSQSRVARTGTAVRSVAADLLEVSRANGCGLQTGSEPIGVLSNDDGTGVADRCRRAYEAVTGGTVESAADRLVSGDVVVSGIERGGVVFRARIEHRWRPFSSGGSVADLDAADPVGCADLATMNPAVLERVVRLTWPDAPDERVVIELEAVPPDAAANDAGFGAVLVRFGDDVPDGMGVSVDLVRGDDPTVVLRRGAATVGEHRCAWFPMLAPGEYTFDIPAVALVPVPVSAGQTTVVEVGDPS